MEVGGEDTVPHPPPSSKDLVAWPPVRVKVAKERVALGVSDFGALSVILGEVVPVCERVKVCVALGEGEGLSRRMENWED